MSAPVVDARIVRTRKDVLQAALDVVIDEGREAVTHLHVAEVAGYARATVYKHWPTRTDLLTAAFGRLAEMEHHAPTGDLRGDLVAELMTFRTGMEQHRLDRALAVLADLATSVPDLAEVRDRLVGDGEREVRRLLSPRLSGTALDSATLMLCGAVLHCRLLHGELPSDEYVSTMVDLLLDGIGTLSR